MKFCYFLLVICFILINKASSFQPEFNELIDKRNLVNEENLSTDNDFNDDTFKDDEFKDVTDGDTKLKDKTTQNKKSEDKITKSNSGETTTISQPTKTNSKKSNRESEVDVGSILSDIVKYKLLNEKQFNELCSDKLLDKSPSQSLHLSGNNFILILDEYNLTFKFELDNKYYPKLIKLPYRCTSYCEDKIKYGSKSNYTSINRFKYDRYLVESLGAKDYSKITFYLENLDYLKSENQSDKHLVEALTFTIEKDGCTSPIGNPKLRDNYHDNLVTKDLIKMFCNKNVRENFRNNNEFLIQELDSNNNTMFKTRHLIFFQYPIVTAYNLSNDAGADVELQKTNLANRIKNIKNAVQLKTDENDFDSEKFIVFNNQQMFILQKQETQLVELEITYSIQNYYACSEPLCLDPYFDDLFIIKSCDLESFFDFIPKSSRLLVAFRGNYFYLINASGNLKAPKINQAIPIDYLFKEILNRPDIDFNYLDAAEYVKKSDIIILFKDDKYLLIDPFSKIVNGPFDLTKTFRYAKNNPDTVYMDGNYLVMIKDNTITRYLWLAPSLLGSKDVVLSEYVTYHQTANMNELESTIDASYKENDMIYLFIGDNVAEFKLNKNNEKNIKIKETALEYFTNCDSIFKKINLAEKENMTNLESIYDYLIIDQNIGNKILGRNLTIINGTETNSTFTDDDLPLQNTTSPNNSSFKINFNYLIQLITFTLILKNLFKTI